MQRDTGHTADETSTSSRWPKPLASFAGLIVALVFAGVWISASTGATTADDIAAAQDLSLIHI